jgi:hypothetical protein
MGQAGGGGSPAFGMQLFGSQPLPGLTFPGGYGMHMSVPYRAPAAATVPQAAVVAPPPQQPVSQPPQYIPQTYTAPPPSSTTISISAPGGGQSMATPTYLPIQQQYAPPLAPPPSVAVQQELPLILEPVEEKKGDFPWWVLIPLALMAT